MVAFVDSYKTGNPPFSEFPDLVQMEGRRTIGSGHDNDQKPGDVTGTVGYLATRLFKGSNELNEELVAAAPWTRHGF